MRGFTAADLPDLSGKTIIVTGASNGLGLETAKALAGAGAHVVLAVRDKAKGERVAAGLPGSTEVRLLDLASLHSVRAFARDWSGPVDVLVNNAGVMVAPPGSRTSDGFELRMGTNLLGHFALTNLLLPDITGRVVSLTSMVYKSGHLDFDVPDWTFGKKPYARSKLAILLFTSELQRRLTAAGSPVTAVVAHPGYAITDILTANPNKLFNFFKKHVTDHVMAQDAASGALCTLYAATADIPGDSFVGPGGLFELRGAPRLVTRAKVAADPATAARLWQASEALTGVRFPEIKQQRG